MYILITTIDRHTRTERERERGIVGRIGRQRMKYYPNGGIMRGMMYIFYYNAWLIGCSP